MGHDPQQEQDLFAVGSWRVAGSCTFTYPVTPTPRMTVYTHTRTHTQPEPKLCIHTCVYSQPRTHRPTSRGIITQLCKITAVQLITVLGPHPPPHSQAAPPRNIMMGSHAVLFTHSGAMPRSHVGHLTPTRHQNPATQSPHGIGSGPPAPSQRSVSAYCPEADGTESEPMCTVRTPDHTT